MIGLQSFKRERKPRGMIPRCYNRPPYAGLWVRAGYRRGKILLRWIPHRMSQECRAWHTGDHAVPVPQLEGWRCEGCRWFTTQSCSIAAPQ